MEDTSQQLKFDEAMTRLETLVASIESGRLTLEQTIEAFEEGMKLNKFCTEKLSETQKKIEKLVKNSNGELGWKEMPNAPDI